VIADADLSARPVRRPERRDCERLSLPALALLAALAGLRPAPASGLIAPIDLPAPD
jgi:hypothetical protein